MFTKHELALMVNVLGRGFDQAEDGSWEVDELETFSVYDLKALLLKVKALKDGSRTGYASDEVSPVFRDGRDMAGDYV